MVVLRVCLRRNFCFSFNTNITVFSFVRCGIVCVPPSLLFIVIVFDTEVVVSVNENVTASRLGVGRIAVVQTDGWSATDCSLARPFVDGAMGRR